MAGGSYTTMNKVIPGVYYSIENQQAQESLLSPSGVLAWISPQVWGEDVVSISLDDYARDRTYHKIGRHNTDVRLQIFSQYCNSLICINPSKDRKKAEALIRAAVPAVLGTASTYTLGIDIIKSEIPVFDSMSVTADSDFKLTISLKKDGSDVTGTKIEGIKLEQLLNGSNGLYKGFLFDASDNHVSGMEDHIKNDGWKVSSASTSTTIDAEDFTPTGHSTVHTVSIGIQAVTQAEIPELKAVAKYPGSLGNLISIVVTALSDGRKEVRTTLDGIVVDKQRIVSWSKFVDNDYVAIEGYKSFQPEVVSAINLSGGENGYNEPDQIRSDVMSGSYQFVALDSNFNVDGVKLKVESDHTIKLISKVGEEIDSVAGTSTSVAKILSFSLEDGTVLNLKMVDLADNDVSETEVVDPTNGLYSLNGGNHGFIAGLGNALEFLRHNQFNVVVADSQEENVRNAICSFVESLGENSGKYRRCVVLAKDTAPVIDNKYNSMYVTSLGQTMADDEGLTAFTIAAMECGCSWNRSCTYQAIPLPGDPDIILSDEQLEDWISKGIMCISKREDDAWCITKDINTLHDIPENIPSILIKNRAVRFLESFRNTVKMVWEVGFAGQVTNDPTGRNLFKGRVCEILNEYVTGRGIANYDSEDIVVMEGNTADAVVLICSLRLYDSMEVLYVKIVL